MFCHAQGHLGVDLGTQFMECVMKQFIEEPYAHEYQPGLICCDIAALIATRNVEVAHLRLYMVMGIGNGGIRDDVLSVAFIKTEIVTLTKKCNRKIILMLVGDREIETRPTEKHLGVVIYRKSIFGGRLNILMPNSAEKSLLSAGSRGGVYPLHLW